MIQRVSSVLVLLLFVGLSFSLTTRTDSIELDWELVQKSSEFLSRDSAGEIYYKKRHYLIGGYNHDGDLSDVWSTVDFKNWERHSDVPCKAVVHPLVFELNDQVFVTCSDNSLFKTADFQNYELVESNTPFRSYYGLCVTKKGDRIYIFSGTHSDSKHNFVFETSDGKQWSKSIVKGPSLRQCHSGFHYFKDLFYIIGGRDAKNFDIGLNDIWISKNGKDYVDLKDAPWTPQFWDSIINTGEFMVKAGGYHLQDKKHVNLNSVYVTKDGFKWIKIKSNSIWPPRHEVSLFFENGNLNLIGGNQYPVMDDVWRLDLSKLEESF